MARRTIRSCAAFRARSKTRNSSYRRAAIYLSFRRERKIYIYIYDYRGETEETKRNETNERTDEHALTHKSAHLTTRVDHKPFTQNELQLVQHLDLVVVIIIIVADVLALCYAPLKDRFGTQIVSGKVGRL